MAYVSDLIEAKEIENWTPQEIIFIKAGTGSGKTTFLKTTLLGYSKQHGKRILYLANRIALQQQTKFDINNAKEIQGFDSTSSIDVATYQGIAWRILHDKRIENYDYIVCDECHYFTSDSNFNNSTDVTFEWMIHQPAIKVLMSATPDLILEYIRDKLKIQTKIYPLDIDYTKLISEIAFYKNEEIIENHLLKRQNDGIKRLYFGTAKNAFKISQMIENSAFYCSKNNGALSDFNSQEEFDNIITNSKFNCGVFATTSIFDNGVNFKDKNLKEIFIEYMSPDEVVQMIGRKRFTDKDEKVIVYIKTHSKLQLTKRLESVEKQQRQIAELRTLGEIEFTNKYTKRDLSRAIDVVVKDNQLHYRINPMIEFKLHKEKEFYSSLIDKKKFATFTFDAYSDYIISKLNFHYGNYGLLENYNDSNIINNYLKSLLGKQLFDEKQEKLKEFLCSNDEIFSKCKQSHNRLGIKHINGYLNQMNCKYIIKSKEETSRKSEHFRKRYWYIDNQTDI